MFFHRIFQFAPLSSGMGWGCIFLCSCWNWINFSWDDLKQGVIFKYIHIHIHMLLKTFFLHSNMNRICFIYFPTAEIEIGWTLYNTLSLQYRLAKLGHFPLHLLQDMYNLWLNLEITCLSFDVIYSMCPSAVRKLEVLLEVFSNAWH